jgi:nucleotide-binding universal stress UspA family protein
VQTRALFVLPKPEQVGLLPEAGQSDAESLQDRGFDQTSLRDGKKQSLAERISALAREIHADLIVTASHHPRFLVRLFTLDQAPEIMRRAPCPVLVYHDKNI